MEIEELTNDFKKIDINLNKNYLIRKIQSCWRGYLTRSFLRKHASFAKMKQFETKTKPDADNCLEVVKQKAMPITLGWHGFSIQ